MDKGPVMDSAVVIVAAVAVVTGCWWYSCWRYPFRPCRWCARGRVTGMWPRAFGECPRCGGKGRHPRFGLRIFNPAKSRQLRGKQ